jgi:hypothetical protein
MEGEEVRTWLSFNFHYRISYNDDYLTCSTTFTLYSW